MSASWQHDATIERIASWRQAVAEGRRRLAEIERRATYPANADPDTVALADHYRLTYPRARILKALSYFTDVTPADLAAVTGIHRALLTVEVVHAASRAKTQVEIIRGNDRSVIFYRLLLAADRDEIRAVIQTSWEFGRAA